MLRKCVQTPSAKFCYIKDSFFSCMPHRPLLMSWVTMGHRTEGEIGHSVDSHHQMIQRQGWVAIVQIQSEIGAQCLPGVILSELGHDRSHQKQSGIAVVDIRNEIPGVILRELGQGRSHQKQSGIAVVEIRSEIPGVILNELGQGRSHQKQSGIAVVEIRSEIPGVILNELGHGGSQAQMRLDCHSCFAHPSLAFGLVT